MATKPTVKRGPASRYASTDETIVEVFSRGIKAGCLLSIREVETPQGRVLVIAPYRADPQVRVHVGRRYLKVAS